MNGSAGGVFIARKSCKMYDNTAKSSKLLHFTFSKPFQRARLESLPAQMRSPSLMFDTPALRFKEVIFCVHIFYLRYILVLRILQQNNSIYNSIGQCVTA